MKKRSFSLAVLTSILLTACSFGRSNINGGDNDQPIMDGWTYEQAAEYWLGSLLEEEWYTVANGRGTWLSPDSLARLSKGHVNVELPVFDSHPMPHWDTTYHQTSTGGFITFKDSATSHPTANDDTIKSIGIAHYHFKDNMLPESADTTVFIQSRGKGIFLGFLMSRVRSKRDDGTWTTEPYGMPKICPFIISVYPGGDSLLVSRGRTPIETFVIDRK